MNLVNDLLVVVLLTSAILASSVGNAAPPVTVPGVVVDHSPASSRQYIGSPGIAILPNGDYLAKLDLFGPGSDEKESGRTRVFRSRDKGRTWSRVAELRGMYWATLFVHQGYSYLIGTNREYGNVVLRKSTDNGVTWTIPTDANSGLLLGDGRYHCAPVPVIVHNGRLWRAMEDARGPGGWGSHFRAFMLSAPVDADLLKADSWIKSNVLARDSQWNNNDFGGWLEGNAVVTPAGKIVDILRVDTRSADETVALVAISDDGRSATFDPVSGLVPFPGGAKKFTIRWDPVSKRYWSVVNWVPPRHRGGTPGAIRNTLALVCSEDLRRWVVRSVLLYHPESAHHGFQYVDWLFDGDDLVFVSRTAFEEANSGAHSYHDANYLTFHRITRARDRTMDEGVPIPELPQVRYEIGDVVLSGRNFAVGTLANGEKSFANRDYVWDAVPEPIRNAMVTRTRVGEDAEISVSAKQDTTIYFATAVTQPGVDAIGWERTSFSFHYTDVNKTVMTVFRRSLKKGEAISIPQANWTGSLVLVPALPHPTKSTAP